jgi:hypothetical protein
MKRISYLLVLAVLIFTNKSFSQKLTALEVLKKATEVAGGETWHNPKTLLLKGDADFTPYGLADEKSAIHFDKYLMYRIFPPYNDEAHKANGKVRFDAAYKDSTFFLLNFDGKKQTLNLSERAKPYAKQFNLSNNFGFSIIRFADKPEFQTTLLADDYVDGNPCYMIKIIDPKKNMTVFGIDKKDFYIRQVAFSTEVGFHHRIYSDFKKAKNVSFLQPTRLRIYFEGLKWVDIHWREFYVNQPIDDKVFVVEEGK